MGKSTISMAMFNCYVSSLEGKRLVTSSATQGLPLLPILIGDHHTQVQDLRRWRGERTCNQASMDTPKSDGNVVALAIFRHFTELANYDKLSDPWDPLGPEVFESWTNLNHPQLGMSENGVQTPNEIAI